MTGQEWNEMLRHSDRTHSRAATTVRQTTLTPAFKLVFLTVLGLTVGALIANIILVVAIPNPNDDARTLIDTCSTIVKTGFGAIVGLLGGKAV